MKHIGSITIYKGTFDGTCDGSCDGTCDGYL